jgi:predicted glycosyltransferase
MRKCRPDKQQAIFADAFLDSIDLILLPHTEEEFGYCLPEHLQHKSAFIGSIVRRADPAKQPDLRAKYGLNAGDFVLTSTVGGGGFTEQAQAFFKTVFTLHQRIQGQIPNLRHIVVLGPNFDQPLNAPEGMLLVDQEPNMTDLIALSDLVVAEGGYNTVNEIRLAKTPAVFLPSVRNLDDQEERVRALESAGLAAVFLNEFPNDTAAELADICCNPARLIAMRQAYTNDHMAVGNRLAAEKLVALAQ